MPTAIYANHDTDADGVTDETEALEGTDPTDPNDTPIDRAITPFTVLNPVAVSNGSLAKLSPAFDWRGLSMPVNV